MVKKFSFLNETWKWNDKSDHRKRRTLTKCVCVCNQEKKACFDRVRS